ncbi:MAG: hypothetical protein CMF40_00640 [Legionellales bacterium]|nr:hypothetical protein [Legionellales bacterium]|tara:strand:- start:930 stop:1313 length:384 start_codon:yes stop_codon:yes gene_type:complete
MTNNVTDNISNDLPAIYRAEKLQQNAAQYGFDWVESSDIVKKIEEELYEVIDVLHDKSKLSEELGDLIFSCINLARYNHIDTELALQNANNKFVKRFNYIEDTLRKNGKSLKKATLEEMDELWDEAK